MKRICLGITFLLISFFAVAQKGKITGTIKDNTTGEPLIGATVLIGPGVGTVTDYDGKFSIDADYGEYTLTVSFVGFEPITQQINVDRKILLLKDFELGSKTLTEVQVIADVARDRETPVAFANVLPAQIEEELASQDIPMILNSTPGVYATQSGGGDGDARITIRGFNQRNIAVMIDGMPVNDMENGWVYWSNWFGLDIVTQKIQVQRGLGASKVAVPSVGGSMSILTKGIDAKESISIKQEIGTNGFSRTSLGVTTGRLDNGWGFTYALSYKRGNGYIDKTFTEGWFYYGKAQKRYGKHLISISAMGAPQKHGQRSYKNPISFYDKNYARKIFKGDEDSYNLLRDYNQAVLSLDGLPPSIKTAMRDSVDKLFGLNESSYNNTTSSQNFIDTTGADDHGLKYNQHWGYLRRNELNGEGDTLFGEEQVVHEKMNYYHKPQFALRDFWSVNEKLSWSNMLYLSIGNGGGTGSKPSISSNDYTNDGQIDWQTLYNANTFSSFSNPDVAYSGSELKSSQIIRSARNNHFWYGLLSTLSYSMNDKIQISGGLDLRDYKGEHYQEVYDLLGGDYYINDDDQTTTNNATNPDGTKVAPETLMKRKGDKIAYHNDGKVRWGGIFGQVEYKSGNISAFLSVSGTYSGYKRIDYFKNKDIVIDGVVYEQAVDFGGTFYHNGTNYISAFQGDTVTTSGDTTFINSNYILNATGYTVDSKEARYTQRDWKWLTGATIKGGVNYNLNEFNNVFINLGYLSKTPRFKNVIDYNNQYVDNAKNEIISAIELGYSLRKKKLAANINGYFTQWENKPLTKSYFLEDGEAISVSIQGMKALHMGFEFDAAYKATDKLQLEGLLSLGEWKWKSGDSSIVYDDALDSVGFIVFDATNVHVGDAAQTQLGGSIRYEFMKGLYMKCRATYFGRHYADFDPFLLGGTNSGRESWKMPDYYLIDLHAGHTIKFDKYRLAMRISVLNLFNYIYISDGDNGGKFDANTASVFFGLGRRYNLSLKLTI